MKELLELLTNPTWWISVFFVGVLINIISSFLYGLLNRSFRRADNHFAELDAARKEALIKQVKELRNNKSAMYLASLDELRTRMKMTNSYVVGIFAFLYFQVSFDHPEIPRVYAILMLALATVMSFLGYLYHRSASRKSKIISMSISANDK